MWKDKSAGVKILWLWTFGTAAILVTNVARTRMRDMEQYVKSDQHQDQDQKRNSHVNEVVVGDNPSVDSATEIIREEKL